jgi:hypothetical protein
MYGQSLTFVAIALATAACAMRAPEPAGVAPGTPHISWIIMHGDRDNPDREFACQSDPRNDCVVPASSAETQMFADVHVYYHGAGADTTYAGSVQIGFFQGAAESNESKVNITVKKDESITNQSITGIVTNSPGTYALAFTFDAATRNTGRSQPIRDRVSVVVK